ncbi:hypothetical protein [Alistipes sp.]|uniref:hypothetical protein n=1 Tax=Alistipes sp. TaxID=1872444 RepID=UPI003A87862B
MSIGYQISAVLEQLTLMGVSFGIVGYFIYREWGRRRESMTMLERMTPGQLADIRRVDAEIEIDRKRRSAGNLWFLRFGMAICGIGVGLLIGLECFDGEMFNAKGSGVSPIAVFKILSMTVVGMGLFIFFEFLIELWLRRSVERRCQGERR